MMYSIDLLKGQGRPKPKKRGTLLLIGLASVIPVLILFYLTSEYVFACADIPIKKTQLEKTQSQNTAQDLQADSTLVKCQAYLKDIDRVIGKNIQWSNILVEIVSEMPDSVIMDSLKNRSSTYTEEIQSPANPDQMVRVTRNRNIISMSFVADNISTADSDMQRYVKNLTASGLDAVIKNQGTAYVKDKPVKVYQIECIIEKG